MKQYINQYDCGLRGFATRANELAKTHGERFALSTSLAGKADKGETYQ